MMNKAHASLIGLLLKILIVQNTKIKNLTNLTKKKKKFNNRHHYVSFGKCLLIIYRKHPLVIYIFLIFPSDNIAVFTNTLCDTISLSHIYSFHFSYEYCFP